MSHEDAGHYAAKHPPGTVRSPKITAALQQAAEDAQLSCVAAHHVAEDLGVSPAEIGVAADLLEYRIVRCQLGLFGYTPEKRIVKPAAEVSDELRDHLTRTSVEGRIDCAVCWDIARMLGVAKLEVSSACESLGLKVRHCQLGAF